MKLSSKFEIFSRKPLVNAVQLGLMMSLSITAMATETADDSSYTYEPTTTLDTITVYGKSYRTTGTKTSLEPEDAPMSYKRIDEVTLEERQADSVNAALRYEPSVSSESRGTVTLFDEYRIRGFDTQTNYYDGVRLAYDGAWNLRPQVDAYATEAVEVVKGSASSLYGYGSPGGMVNQVSKTPQSTPAHQVRVRGGNQNLKEVAVDSTGPLTDTLNYRVVALGRQKDGQMQTTEEEKLLVNPSLEWQATDSVNVLTNIYYQDDPKALPSVPLPALGTVYEASYGKLDSQAYAGDNWVNFERKVMMPTVSINWDINDNLSFKHVSRYTDAEASQKNIYNRGLLKDYAPDQPNADAILVRDAYITEESMTNYSTDNQLAFKFDTGKARHNLLLGIEYQDTDSKVLYKDAGSIDPATFTQFTPMLNLANPDFSLVDHDALPLDNYVQNDDISIKQLGYYLQDEMTLDNLTLIAGVRYDDFKSTNDQTKAVQGNIYEQGTLRNDASETSGRLAAIYKFDNGIAPFIGYSQSFEPVVGSNFITGEAFEPTVADQIEVGFKYDDNDTKASVAAYQINQENVVVSDYVNYRDQTQTGEIESQGFEMSVQNRVNDWIDLAIGYSYTDAEITKEELNPEIEGNTPAQVAKHKATLWGNFYPTERLKLNAGIRYQAGMKIDRQNTDTLPAVTLVDVGGDYQFNDWLSVGASVSNVFDKSYVGACYDLNNCWMGPERQMVVSVKADF